MNQLSTSIPIQGSYGVTADGPRETLRNLLELTTNVLNECEGLAYDITAKLAGPIPQATATSAQQVKPETMGLASQTQDVHSRAMRIRDILQAITTEMA